MASVESGEPVLVLRQTQDTFDLEPPVSVPIGARAKPVDVGRVQVAWETDGEFAEVSIVAFAAGFDRAPFISHVYPVLLDVFKSLIERTRPTPGSQSPSA